jgi:AhpD family alkylhydroperoxidase
MEQLGYVQASIDEYKEGLGWFQEKCPSIANKYIEYTAACFQPGKIPEKDKHLIALGIGVHAQDEYCIMYHAHRALELGANEEEILETIGVCAAFGGGASLSQGVTLIQDVIDEFQTKTH